MFVAKTSLTGDEPPELVTMARRDDDQSFPNDPTTDQFLPPHLFEAYVTLGKHIGDEIDELIELRKLPAGWLPELMVGGPEPAVSHLDDTDHPTTDAVDTEDIRQLLRHLDEQPFDEKEIDRALGVIGKSLATLAAKPSDTMQAAATEEVVSMIRSWSVERGEDSSPPRRRRFCDGLLQLMSEFDETILADLDLKYHFLWMLRIGSDFTHIAKKISSISSSDKDIAETQEQE